MKLTAKNVIREVVPPFLLSLGRRVLDKNGKNGKSQALRSDKGAKYLQYAREYSAQIGGESIAFERGLDELISSGDNSVGRVNQEMLVAFSPHYKQNLYAYYKNQQYNLLFRFLQYPFLHPTLAHYIEPYTRGIDRFDAVDLLDYGCGIPYGLLEVLATPRRDKIRSVTLIDLDLLHMDFTEYLIRRLAPGLALTVHRLRDTEQLPALAGRYNVINGKDIFEHLTEPEAKLRRLVGFAAERGACYFDFADRGKAIYQHVSPVLSPLHAVMSELGFERRSEIQRVTEFVRG